MKRRLFSIKFIRQCSQNQSQDKSNQIYPSSQISQKCVILHNTTAQHRTIAKLSSLTEGKLFPPSTTGIFSQQELAIYHENEKQFSASHKMGMVFVIVNQNQSDWLIHDESERRW